MKRWALPILLAAWLPQAHAASGLCQTDETVFFSCQTRSKKWISLCGTLPASLQYRFGKPGKVELQYPENGADGKTSFFYRHYFRYQFDYTQISFKNKDTDYTLSYGFNGENDPKKPDLSGGVDVTAMGQPTDIQCTGKITQSLYKLGEFLGCESQDGFKPGDQCQDY